MKQCDKKSLLTLCLGAAGMSLRLLQNMTGFEPGTGLPVPGSLPGILLPVLLVLSVEPEDAALLVLPPPPQPLRMPVTSMAADRRTAKVFFFIIQYLSCFVNLRFIMC